MLRARHGLVLSVIGLLAIGVVMVTSAGLMVGGGEPIGLLDVLLGRAGLFALLAVGALLLGSRIDLTRLAQARGWRSPVPWIVVGAVVLLALTRVPGVGHQVNGAWRWVRIGPVGFQPSEFAKWGMIIVVAHHAARHAASMHRFRVGFLFPMAVVGAVCAMIATEDLGTAVLIGLVTTTMLVVAGASFLHVGMLVPVGVAGFVAAVVTSPYRVDRLRAFLDPYADPQGIGYHVIQSMAAIAGGGLTGRGLGNGLQKFGYLPEDTTDFVFAIVAEELGIFGAASIVGLYALLLLCGFAVVRKTTSPFAGLLGLGILLTIGLQALINLLVVTGLAPTKGIALPLVSAGGTGWCLTAFSIGLLVAIDRSACATERGAGATDAPPSTPALAPVS